MKPTPKLPLPKTSVRRSFTNQQPAHARTISLKGLELKTARDSPIHTQLTERETNVQTPISSMQTVSDEALMKQIQTKLMNLEDQISKVELTQDTMRPILRQI